MKEEQTSSWIFLATALASDTEPSDIRRISFVADGINHAVPAQKELQMSFSWLIMHGLMHEAENKYELTQKGKREFAVAKHVATTLFQMWEKLELTIKNYGWRVIF
jgi:hypothetical protein